MSKSQEWVTKVLYLIQLLDYTNITAEPPSCPGTVAPKSTPAQAPPSPHVWGLKARSLTQRRLGNRQRAETKGCGWPATYMGAPRQLELLSLPAATENQIENW